MTPHFLDLGGRELAGMHAQTWYLRQARTGQPQRLPVWAPLSQHDVELLRQVQRLSQDEGVNLRDQAHSSS